MPGKDIKNSRMPASKLVENQHVFLSDLAKACSEDEIMLVAQMLSHILTSSELDEKARIERAVEIAQNYLSTLVRGKLVIDFPQVIEGLVMQLTEQGVSQTITDGFKDKISAKYSLKNHLQKAVNNCARSISEQDSSRIDTRFFEDVCISDVGISSDYKLATEQQTKFKKIAGEFVDGWLTPKGRLGRIRASFRKQSILSENEHAREAIIFLLGDKEYGLEYQLLAVIMNMFYKIGMMTSIYREMTYMNISTTDSECIKIEYSGSFKLYSFYGNIEDRKQYNGNFKVIINLIPEDEGFTIEMNNFDYDLGVPELEGKMKFYLPKFPITPESTPEPTSELLPFPQEQQPDERENNNSSLEAPETQQKEFSVSEPKSADEFLKTAKEMSNTLSQKGMGEKIGMVKLFQKLELFFSKYSYLLSYEQIQNLRNENSDYHLKKMANAYYLSNYFIERNNAKSKDIGSLIKDIGKAFEDAKCELKSVERLIQKMQISSINVNSASKKIKTEELMLRNLVKNGETIEKKLEKLKAWKDAYAEFKQICNECGLNGEQQQKLLLGAQKDLFNILEQHQDQLIGRWKEARSNMEKLSRQINKVSRSLLSADISQKNELIQPMNNIKNTCNEKNIITGRIKRAWESFKSSPIGRLFGLKTNEEKEFEKIRPMQIVDSHTFELPSDLGKAQSKPDTYNMLFSELKKGKPDEIKAGDRAAIGEPESDEDSDSENAQKLEECTNALMKLGDKDKPTILKNGNGISIESTNTEQPLQIISPQV